MKKGILLLLVLVQVMLVSCSKNDRGELIGVRAKKAWTASEKPFGMVLVPGGSFTMGKTEENRWGGFEPAPKGVTVKEFFMDETEVTNSEYKEFVYWVRDSIVRTKLAEFAETASTDAAPTGKKAVASIADYKYLNSDLKEGAEGNTPYQNYMLKTYGFVSENAKGTRPLNWKSPLYWSTSQYPDESYAEVMSQLYLPSKIAGDQKVFDNNLLNYSYSTKEKKSGVAAKNNVVDLSINVYPDTAVWVKDFSYSQNDVMLDNYFWHSAFEEYPVVGVSWAKAEAFCNWRTKKKNDFLKSNKAGYKVPQFRLPSEAEWEYAARGGIQNGMYPWGGPYVMDSYGQYLANFRPKRNDLAADGYTYTVEALSFEPNDYGLYNMAGNVAEWTNTSYNTSALYVTSSLNADVQDPLNKRKIIRGGSWKDIAYFLEVSSRDFEYADSAKSYIGFRTVQDYLGNATFNR